MRRALAGLAAAAVFAGCAAAPAVTSTDRVWSTKERRYVAPEAVVAAARRADYVLLGERHDNPEHHRLQAAFVAAYAGAASDTAVALEMVPADRQPAVDAWRAAGAEVDAFAAAVSWSALGWPPFAMYAPVVTAAAARGYRLVAADVAKPLLREVRTKGAAAVDAAWASRTGLAAPLPATAQTALEQDIDRAHCGYAPKALLPQLVYVQRLRDATLAAHLAEAPRGLLVAGAGHVHEHAAPLYLARLRPGATVVTVAFAEGTAEEARAVAGYDYVWPTSRADAEDPCEKYRESLERMHKR